MGKTMAKIFLIGRIAEPTVRHTEASGKPIVTFGLATSDRDKSGEYLTTWNNVVMFGRTAELFEHKLLKGMELFISGGYRLRPWVDKDGNDKMSPEVTAWECIILNNPIQRDGDPTPTIAEAPQEEAIVNEGSIKGDVPF